MGRYKKRDRDMPPRMRRKHGAYYYVVQQRWHRLAPLSDPATAFARYRQLEHGGRDDSTLGAAIDRYLAEHVPTLAPQTQRDYRRACGNLRAWCGDLPLDAVHAPHVAQYLDTRTPPTQANRDIAVLSSIYQRAIRWRWASRNPCTGVPRNPQKPRRYVPSRAEIQQLRANAAPRMRLAIDLALQTALRLSDQLQLRVGDAAEEGLRAIVSKTCNTTVYPWTPQLRATVDELLAMKPRVGDHLICNRTGRGYTLHGWETVWRRHKTAAGLAHIRWHDLRARALTDAAHLRGRDYAQALAAHAAVTTTERYIRDRGVAIVDPLDVDYETGSHK